METDVDGVAVVVTGGIHLPRYSVGLMTSAESSFAPGYVDGCLCMAGKAVIDGPDRKGAADGMEFLT